MMQSEFIDQYGLPVLGNLEFYESFYRSSRTYLFFNSN